MAGVAIAVADTREKLKGPIWWFAGCKNDIAAGAPVGLALDPTNTFKTPDAAVHTTAFGLGCTADGWKLTSDFSQTEEFCDESPIPEFTAIDSQTINLEANLRNPLNSAVLEKLWGLIKDANAADGWDVYSGGSISAIVETALIGVFKQVNNPTKYGYIYYPKAALVSAFNLDAISRKKASTSLVRFSILSNAARGVGKEVFDIGLET